MEGLIKAKMSINKNGNSYKGLICYEDGYESFFSFIIRQLNKGINTGISSTIFLELSTAQESAVCQNGGCVITVVIHTPRKLLTGYASEGNVNTFAQQLLKNEKPELKLRKAFDDILSFCNDDEELKNKVNELWKNLYRENNNSNDVTICPIIHITLTDIFIESLFSDKELHAKVPRSFQVMDNSIWNYLVPLFDVCYDYGKYGIEKKSWENVLKEAIDSIYKNHEKGLYDLDVATEYADLNARLAFESYLSGSHAGGVSPFIYHSEQVMKYLINKEYIKPESKILEDIKKKKWRILLVDDKAKKPMENRRKEYVDNSWNCKNTIIKNVIAKQFDLLEKEIDIKPCDSLERIDKDCIFSIDYAENLEAAKKALKEKLYDIILLDYLLKQNGQEYGYELLNDIFKHIDTIDPLVDDLRKRYNSVKDSKPQKKQEDIIEILKDLHDRNSKYKDLLLYIEQEESLSLIYKSDLNLEEKLVKLLEGLRKYKIGPCGRFFFMFISAYSSAVYERLLAEGLNQSEDYWHIAVGACPTNTPQLFLYNLIKLMEKRIEDSHIKKISADGIISTLGKIYNQEGQIRKNAGEHYKDIQSYQYYYRSILKDYKVLSNKESVFDTKGSVLMTDFMTSNVNLGGLLEHMAQLVHLTAFGTVRQWPEMWEEYIYFKSLLSSQIRSDNKEFDVLCGNIENYIKSLKFSTL